MVLHDALHLAGLVQLAGGHANHLGLEHVLAGLDLLLRPIEGLTETQVNTKTSQRENNSLCVTEKLKQKQNNIQTITSDGKLLSHASLAVHQSVAVTAIKTTVNPFFFSSPTMVCFSRDTVLRKGRDSVGKRVEQNRDALLVVHVDHGIQRVLFQLEPQCRVQIP